MHATQNVTIPDPDRRPLLVREQRRGQAAKGATVFFLLYVFLLGGVSIHLSRKPFYSMDSIQYMGNALLMEERDPVRIHQRVYGEIQRSVPKEARDALLGHQVGARRPEQVAPGTRREPR